MSNSRLYLNARAIGSSTKISHEPPEMFRLTCKSCEEKVDISGREKALKWEKAHKKTHGKYASMVFVTWEAINLQGGKI